VTTPKDDRPDRDGKRLLATHVDESVHRAFKTAAAKQGMTSVALMHDAVTLALVAHGESLPPTIREHVKSNGNAALAEAIRKLRA
jgi:antitoxin component of RelBE/YafQ-DinJ toxin-antitoxin module